MSFLQTSRIVLTDVHFLIPLTALAFGLALLVLLH